MIYTQHEVVCPVYNCGHVYSTGHRFNYDIQCPKCGISVNEIDEVGTNDREVIYEARKNSRPKMEETE